jgi:hypothetical protein
VEEESESEFSSSDDKGKVRENVHVNEVGRMSTVIGGRSSAQGRGPTAPAMPPVSASQDCCALGRSRQCLNRNWNDHQLQASLRAIDQGLPVGIVASQIDIPRSTLRSHITGMTKVRKRGQAPVLTAEEEQQLVDYIIQMQELGFPLSFSQLKLKVALITQKRATPFVHGIPGAGWLRWFRRHHP